MRSAALDAPATGRRRGGTTLVQRHRPKRARKLGYSLVLILAISGIALIAAGRGRSTVSPPVSTGAGTLDFTVYSPPTVERASYLYRDGTLTLGTPRVIARLPGADGIAYTPSGDLVVGGQTSGQIFVIPASGGQPTSVQAGTKNAFLVTLSPSGDDLYTAGLPGTLAEVPLHPLSAGRAIELSGDDEQITSLAFGPGGQVLYTASDPHGQGDIGLLDLRTAHTHRLFTSVVGAHGIMFDRYSNSYLVIGGDTILQLSPSQPDQILSEFTMPGMQFDQGAVTGRGLAFFASNTGYLVTVDYSSSRRIGDLHNKVQTRFLVHNLDDIAPLVGPGARPVPTAAPTVRRAGFASLGAGAVLLLALLITGGRHRPKSKKKTRRLPRWDKRRKSSARRNGPTDLLMAAIPSVTKDR